MKKPIPTVKSRSTSSTKSVVNPKDSDKLYAKMDSTLSKRNNDRYQAKMDSVNMVQNMREEISEQKRKSREDMLKAFKKK